MRYSRSETWAWSHVHRDATAARSYAHFHSARRTLGAEKKRSLYHEAVVGVSVVWDKSERMCLCRGTCKCKLSDFNNKAYKITKHCKRKIARRRRFDRDCFPLLQKDLWCVKSRQTISNVCTGKGGKCNHNNHTDILWCCTNYYVNRLWAHSVVQKVANAHNWTVIFGRGHRVDSVTHAQWYIIVAEAQSVTLCHQQNDFCGQLLHGDFAA